MAWKRRFPLWAQIVAAMAVGLVVGPALGPRASALGEIGKLVIQLIKAAAAPLLFLAIVNAILKTEIRGRQAARLLLWAMLNASIALAIGIGLANLFQPGRALSAVATRLPGGAATTAGGAAIQAGKPIDFLATLGSFVPTSIVAPFVDNQIIPIVVVAVLFGFAFRVARGEQMQAEGSAFRAVEDGIETLLRVTEIALGWVIRLVPYAVFGVVARAVGEQGLAPVKGLAAYVAVGLAGMLVHVLVTYNLWLMLFIRLPLRAFWREAKDPAVYAAGANSSLATLPLTLRALDRLRVPRSASALGAGVGTNLNNDGIILYEGMAVLFVAQAHGLDLSFAQQLVAAGACLIAAVGVAGIPEAGFVSLAVVLTTVGLPTEMLPLLLTVDWIIARARSVTNVLSDMILSLLIGRDQRAP